MKNYPWWLSIVAEIVAIIVFGALAYLFRKWWIALFAILWLKNYSIRQTNGGTQDGERKKDV